MLSASERADDAMALTGPEIENARDPGGQDRGQLLMTLSGGSEGNRVIRITHSEAREATKINEMEP